MAVAGLALQQASAVDPVHGFMELSAFSYDLPPSLIAAFPSREREGSRLLVIRRSSGEIIHSMFADIGDFLSAGDLLVLNDTKVFPARLQGVKDSGGKAEILLIEQFPDGGRSLWIALVDAAKKPRVGSRLHFGQAMSGEVIGDLGRGRYALEFYHDGVFFDRLSELGEPPLPPYVKRKRAAQALDRDRYQTVYADQLGAVAAPTAGFHFTPELFAKLAGMGIERALLTLHIGPGTFQPVRAEQIEHHRMEGERYRLTEATAERIRRTKAAGGRVVAVGSTSTRTLEWVVRQRGAIVADDGVARLYLKPGDSFNVIDGLITNFHLPGSTPLILVAALAGLDLVRRAYAEAIERRYRFYSYGDAMLIL